LAAASAIALAAWEKVREIDKLGLKHGMKLAAISGVHGVITDAQIARVREPAPVARGRRKAGAGRRRDGTSTRRASRHVAP
jgi:hypothetical protein